MTYIHNLFYNTSFSNTLMYTHNYITSLPVGYITTSVCFLNLVAQEESSHSDLLSFL